MPRVAVIGAGAWGTALALALHRTGRHQVTLWSHGASTAESIETSRENTRFLPGFPIPEEIHATTHLVVALEGADIVLTAMPSHHVRTVFGQMKPHLSPRQVIVSATKGIETGTCLRVSEIIRDVLRDDAPPVCVLSGPSFAQEVAAAQPTAVVLASAPETAVEMQRAFSSESLRVYTTDDMAGVEIGGAMKNVIAIASGMVAGLELGANSAAALVTRGLAEMTRLAVACGGRGETLAGLAGVGDLVLTATGGLSRNRTVGMALGRGEKLAQILAGMGGKVAEGVETTRAALELAGRLNVELPITQQVSEILLNDKSPILAMRQLMSRPGRDE